VESLKWEPRIQRHAPAVGKGMDNSDDNSADPFRVLQIDHVEVFVPDRYEAAAWYQRVLGLQIVSAFEEWAASPGGPLMISSDEGSTKLALFEAQAKTERGESGFHRVAFRVSAAHFMDFLSRLDERGVTDHRDRPVTADSVVDHDKAYSIYFSDPYGHRLEVTTYEHDATRAALRERHGSTP
jgi:catechol 2,3-dioxygenase-like lactoylglutathione lyase family enzyme